MARTVSKVTGNSEAINEVAGNILNVSYEGLKSAMDYGKQTIQVYNSFFDFIFLSFLTFSVNVLEINRLCINLGWQKWQESSFVSGISFDATDE